MFDGVARSHLKTSTFKDEQLDLRFCAFLLPKFVNSIDLAFELDLAIGMFWGHAPLLLPYSVYKTWLLAVLKIKYM